MSKDTHRNNDQRPKRRKDKENPYEIFTVGQGTSEVHYYTCFRDGEGVKRCLEIEKEVFDLLDEFEREDLRVLNEYDRHYEHLKQSEQGLFKKASAEIATVEEVVFRRLELGEIQKAIRSLPAKQKKRLVLHRFFGYKIKEIAAMEGCHQSVISRSISAAEKKIKKKITA